jgi:putative DNA primase/helicase
LEISEKINGISKKYVNFLNLPDEQIPTNADLKATEEFAINSGLKPSTLTNYEVKIFRGGEQELAKRLNRNGTTHKDFIGKIAIEIPYFNENGKIPYSRYRYFPPLKKDGDEIKYLSPTGEPAIPYIVPEIWNLAGKTNKPLWITEGEKKAMALIQRNIDAIAIPGVWNTQELFSTSFKWKGRTVILAFDRDLETNPSVRQAFYKFAFQLYSKGAVVHIASWNERDGKGIDDYLENTGKTTEEIQKQTLSDYIPDNHRREVIYGLGEANASMTFLKVELDQLITMIAEKLKINKSSLKKDLRHHKKEEQGEEGLLHLFFEETEEGKSVFNPTLLAEFIMKNNKFKYAPDGDLYHYKSGVYRPYGENFVFEKSQELLGKQTRKNRKAEVIDYVKHANFAEWEEPEKDENGIPKYINLKNGRLEWLTGNIYPHTPERFELFQIPVEYDPQAKCPTFDKYLETTFPEDKEAIKVLEEILGYCLIPDTRFEKAFLLTGEGANGKGTFIDTLAELLGKQNVSSVALQDLEENRFKKAELLGKLANVFADLDRRAMKHSEAFKTLVTGDLITAEKKCKDPFQFRSFARLIFSANEIPRSLDQTYAYYRRWIILPFTQKFEGKRKDYGLREKLKSELPGILMKALRGLCRVFGQRGFTETEATKKALEDYKLSNDTVAAFCDEMVEVENDPGALKPIQKLEFRQKYSEWCEESGYFPSDDRRVKESLKKRYPKIEEIQRKLDGKRYWQGIKWK